jgi:hypothetical protein
LPITRENRRDADSRASNYVAEEREYGSLVQTATLLAILQAEAKKILQNQNA